MIPLSKIVVLVSSSRVVLPTTSLCLYVFFLMIFCVTSTIGKQNQTTYLKGKEIEIDQTNKNEIEHSDGELKGADAHEFNYNDQSNWGILDPTCGTMNRRQSPININTDEVVPREDLKVEFIDYNQAIKFELRNNHHTINLKPVSSISTPSIKLNLSPEVSEYELQEIHFHWGNVSNKGSEHQINGKQAAAEMHVVHYKKGINESDIAKIENSVLVIGVLIETDHIAVNKELEIIVKNAAQVNGTNLVSTIDKPKNLVNLLPNDRNRFYTYNGSLTTPPCLGVVTWIVMNEPVYMKNATFMKFINIETMDPISGKRKIGPNHRDIQPLNGRTVYASSRSLVSSSEQSIDKNTNDVIVGIPWKEFRRKTNGVIDSSLEMTYKQIKVANDIIGWIASQTGLGR